MAPYVNTFLPELEKISQEHASFDLILDTLIILRRLLKTNDPSCMIYYSENYQKIHDIINRGLSHEYAKVVSEALRVAGVFVNVLKSPSGTLDPKYTSVAQPLYASIRAKLQKADIDQEIKQCSIIAMANFLAVCHKNLNDQ